MLNYITLEMSLKPFKKTEEAYMRSVIESVYEQWSILIKEAEEISILLWVADGGEILNWRGNFEQEVEWGKYIGGANANRGKSIFDPEGIALHARPFTYMEEPPVFTYALLKKIISLIKEVGKSIYPDKIIRVGETFDPGPEFAKSAFKYKLHPEICKGVSMGGKTFVCCYESLHEDKEYYAGFPDGIPEGTPFGTFLGRQCQTFLPAMGFDYLWFSNGFGFGSEPWSAEGAIFDGERFDGSQFEQIKEYCLNFWKLFRTECPHIPVQTRGTNFMTGIDLSTDGVPLKDIYEGGFGLLPPPNSPWAALNGDFGLELAGFMSHIAKLPDTSYMFRFYVHDPWWANSPWYDRYKGMPHDIYLPMSVCRVNEAGEISLPSHLNILTVDNCFGDMPAFCACETTMHLKKAMAYAPTDLPPVVWVYPFEEYHAMKDEESLREMFFGDWFIRGALNQGFPMSGVVSTDYFISGYQKNKEAYRGSILVSTVPMAASAYEASILKFIEDGGKVIFYGSVNRASEKFMQLVNVAIVGEGQNDAWTDSADEKEESSVLATGKAQYGEFTIFIDKEADTIIQGKKSDTINHRFLTCGGGINTVLKDEKGEVQSFVKMDDFVVGTASKQIAWLKGTCSAMYTGDQLLEPDSEEAYFCGESLMRYALGKLGYDIRFVKEYVNQKTPTIMLSRHNGAMMFAVCAPDTTVKTRLRFPLGAPIIMGGETILDKEGFFNYNFNKAELRECRVFVEQEEGMVRCHEIAPVSFYMRRRIEVSKLKQATVRFLVPDGFLERVVGCMNPINHYNIVGESFESSRVQNEYGCYYEIKNVTGRLILSIPMDKPGHMTYER